MWDSGTSEGGGAIGRVLVVDDEAAVRSALVRALTFLGFEVEEAESGRKALAQIGNHCYDALLLDMDMPEMTGIEVMQAARKVDDDLAIVVLTGHGTLESAIAAVRYAAVEYLLKPASIERIGETLSKAIAERRRSQRSQLLLRTIGRAAQNLADLDGEGRPPLQLAQPRFVHGGSLMLDRSKRVVMQAGGASAPIALSESEAGILEILMRVAGCPVSCRQLAAEALHYQVAENEADDLVRPHIFRLRQRLTALPGAAEMIRTVRGRGYMFVTQ